jgi:hypothetical protein
MTPALAELRDLIVTHRDAFTRDIVATTPEKEQTTQMVHGFFELLIAALEGREKEIRDMFVEVVMPSLRDAGTPARMMIGGSARVLLVMMGQLSARLSDASRPEAIAWLAAYFGDHLAEMTAVWTEKDRA